MENKRIDYQFKKKKFLVVHEKNIPGVWNFLCFENLKLETHLSS